MNGLAMPNGEEITAMVKPDELVKQHGIGPVGQQQLAEVTAARDAARQRVAELMELKTQRQFELDELRAVPVTAGVAPEKLAKSQGQTAALTEILAKIEADLREARTLEWKAGAAAAQRIEGFQRRAQRIEAIDQEMDRLHVQRLDLLSALAA